MSCSGSDKLQTTSNTVWHRHTLCVVSYTLCVVIRNHLQFCHKLTHQWQCSPNESLRECQIDREFLNARRALTPDAGRRGAGPPHAGPRRGALTTSHQKTLSHALSSLRKPRTPLATLVPLLAVDLKK